LTSPTGVPPNGAPVLPDVSTMNTKLNVSTGGGGGGSTTGGGSPSRIT